jgi:hypothetical protein
MYWIQVLPFDNSKWATHLESEILEAVNISYHIPPKQPLNSNGCLVKLIICKKINQTKQLLERCNKTTSHWFFINVKSRDGYGLSASCQRIRFEDVVKVQGETWKGEEARERTSAILFNGDRGKC